LKKLLKLIAPLVLVICVIAGITGGCAANETVTQTVTESVTATATVTTTVTESAALTPTTTTRTITDSLGRQVTIPAEVDRVVSLSIFPTEIISVLGAKDKIMGVDEWIKRGTMYGAFITKLHPDLQNLPSAGGGPLPVNVEELLAENPDVVLVSGVGTVWTDELEQKGIPVVAVKFEFLDTYMRDIRIVSQVVGKEKEAESLIKYLEGQLELVESRVGDIPEADKVRTGFISLRDGSYGTMGEGTLQHGQMTTAGGNNVFADLIMPEGSHNLEVSVEQFILDNPQVLLTHPMTKVADVMADTRIADVEAVKNARVYALPEPGWDFGSLRSIFSIEWIASLYYPEKFQGIDLDSEADAFFQTIYKTDYTGPSLNVSAE